MTNATHIPSRGAQRRLARLAALAAAVVAVASASSIESDTRTNASRTAAAADLAAVFAEYERFEHLEEQVEHEGRVPTSQLHRRDAVEATFLRDSYRPLHVARLRIDGRRRIVRLRIFRAGVERFRTRRNDLMNGLPVTGVRRVSAGLVRVRIGAWPSGLYFARLSSRGHVGFAPFVVRPYRLGQERIAVVLPTYTWQAYNFRDDDGDGDSDTWYAGWRSDTARINRPYLDRGVPPHFRAYDLPFLRWLHETGRKVDVLTDTDLDGLRSGRKLRRYALLIFPGHHEYVTQREYDAVEDFRDHGGNLMFLSANNFYWRVDRRGNVLTRIRHWRELGRPEASLIGTQYVANDMGEHRGAWMVRRTRAASWIFAGTASAPGQGFSNGGIEIDSVSAASPRGTQILAVIPRIYGPGYNAHMTYYETRRGAKVFAAGAFTLAGAVRQPPVARLVSNLLARLASDRD